MKASSDCRHQHGIDEDIDGSTVLGSEIKHFSKIENEVSQLGGRGGFGEIDGEDDWRRSVDGFDGFL